MCGILGTVNRPLGDDALNVLRHRGPDDSGVSQRQVGNNLITFGHCRLAILDLSLAGHQPMSTSDRNHSIVFNGEIYNHRELRARMSAAQYRGHSDTETILYHLAQHGITSSIEFNGMFALGFLDEWRRKLFLARDPFGVKPLYYWAGDESFVFSSELKAIRQFVDDSG